MYLDTLTRNSLIFANVDCNQRAVIILSYIAYDILQYFRESE